MKKREGHEGPATAKRPEAEGKAEAEAPPQRSARVITEAFAEGIRAAIPAEGEQEPKGDESGRG